MPVSATATAQPVTARVPASVERRPTVVGSRRAAAAAEPASGTPRSDDDGVSAALAERPASAAGDAVAATVGDVQRTTVAR